MYAMNIQNDVIDLVLRENCKSKTSDRLYCMTEQMFKVRVRVVLLAHASTRSEITQSFKYFQHVSTMSTLTYN
jgi:hypothetical protein